MQNRATILGGLVALLGAQACHSITPTQPIVVANKCISFSASPSVSAIILGTNEGITRDGSTDTASRKTGPVWFESPPVRSRELSVIRVRSNATGSDLVLVLTSYRPVIWDLSEVSHSRLRAVLLYGREASQIRGVNADTPVRNSNQKSPLPDCGKPIVAFRGGVEVDQLVDQVRQITGLTVSKFVGGYANADFDIDVDPEVAIAQTLKNDGNRSVESPHDYPPDWPGEAIVKNLVSEGRIRAATQADIDQWNAAATNRLATGALAPFVSENLHVDYTYVVLKPIVLPEGMFGSASRIFIVPADVPTPQIVNNGESHNTFYTLKDGKCSQDMQTEC